MKTYVTFGQDHYHHIGDKIYDKDCVAVIESASASEGRARAFEMFGPKFCFEYPEKFFNMDDMKYYPRGFVSVANPDNPPPPQTTT